MDLWVSPYQHQVLKFTSFFFDDIDEFDGLVSVQNLEHFSALEHILEHLRVKTS